MLIYCLIYEYTIPKRIHTSVSAVSMKNPQLTPYSMKDFPLRSGKRKGSPFLFNTMLEILTTAIRYKKEIKDIQTRKQEIKLYPFTENMILYIETTKKNPPKTYET